MREEYEDIYYKVANSRAKHLIEQNVQFVDRFVTTNEGRAIWSHLLDRDDLFASTPSIDDCIERTYVFESGTNLDEIVMDVDSMTGKGSAVGIRLLVLPK